MIYYFNTFLQKKGVPLPILSKMIIGFVEGDVSLLSPYKRLSRLIFIFS